jgi:glutaminyl-peptide cyclotransferase
MNSRLYLNAALAFSLTLASCGGGDDQDTPPPQPGGQQQQQQALQSKPVPPFDENRAFADVEKQVAFGPRVPNTDAHRKARDFFVQELQAAGAVVQLQDFSAEGYGETLNLSNVVAAFNPTATDRILLLAHWDSRPRSDEEKDVTKQKLGVPAANDGASGVAVLLELARQFKDNPPPVGIDILLTDGEDYGDSNKDAMDKYFLGAKYFAKTKPATYFPRFAILLDLVGDRKAEFRKEGYSMHYAPNVVNFVWSVARDLNLSTFKQTGPFDSVQDDHLPLNEAGIKTIDIIDMDLVGHKSPDPDRKYWHTQNDTMKNISAKTLDEVGTLLLTIIYDRLPKVIRTL